MLLLKKHDMLSEYHDRAYAIVDKAIEGWGHFDTLRTSYESEYGEFFR